MNSFHDLTRSLTSGNQRDGSVGIGQKCIDDGFPLVVAASPFRLWSGASVTPAHGKRLVIGVATWSVHDMKFLDAMARARQWNSPNLTVEVFNVADCSSQEAFERYVPGIGPVFQTPVVGYWSDGKMEEKAAGQTGRELVARVIGAELLDYYSLPAAD